MPPKRRSTGASSASSAKSKKKQKRSSTPEQQADAEPVRHFDTLTEFYTDVINSVLALKDSETGEVISGPFVKLPPKKIYGDYYQLIANPVSINEIRQAAVVKRRGGTSAVDGNGVSLDEFKQMWVQMSENAATYNDPSSLIVNDANTILNYVVERIDSYKSQLDLAAAAPPQSPVEADAGNVGDDKVEEHTHIDDQDQDQEHADEEEVDEKEASLSTKRSRSKKNGVKKPKIEVSSHEDLKDEAVSDEVNGENAHIDEEYDDSDEDYTPDLIKVYKHLLSYKVSHHKNSVPLSKVLLELPDKKDPATEKFYATVKNPICFDKVGENLDKGLYSKGSTGYRSFVDDVNSIFDNVFAGFDDGPYHKAASGLSKAFDKRLEKFDTQVIEKRKLTPSNPKPKLKSKSIVLRLKAKESEENVEEEEEEKNEKEDEEVNDTNLSTEEDVNNESNVEKNETPVPEQVENEQVSVGIPTIVRKHDIEKASKIEEIDDITAFIKKFTICSTTNLNNYVNNMKNMEIHNKGKNTSSNSMNMHSSSVYENIIFEPAGNSTVGGSSYIMQIPGSAIIGHEIACIVYLQNKIVDEKYISELRVNGETISGVPMTITYDQSAGDDGMFCAGKYGVRLGFGLNYFEFTLKVPFPLKEKETDETDENEENEEADETVTEKTEATLEEKRERPDRSDKHQQFVENVKVWLHVTR